MAYKMTTGLRQSLMTAIEDIKGAHRAVFESLLREGVSERDAKEEANDCVGVPRLLRKSTGLSSSLVEELGPGTIAPPFEAILDYFELPVVRVWDVDLTEAGASVEGYFDKILTDTEFLRDDLKVLGNGLALGSISESSFLVHLAEQENGYYLYSFDHEDGSRSPIASDLPVLLSAAGRLAARYYSMFGEGRCPEDWRDELWHGLNATAGLAQHWVRASVSSKVRPT